MPVVPAQIWKLAVGTLTVAQMGAVREFKNLPPQYPTGYDTTIEDELAKWATPDKEQSMLWRAEMRVQTLGGRLQPRGFKRARWFVPGMTYAKLVYLNTTYFTASDDYAVVTIQMPGEFGFESTSGVYNGIMHWPWPEESMQRPGRDLQDWGWRDLEFNFVRLVDAAA